VVLRVEDLTVEFPDGHGGWVQVVDEVSFELRRGEALGFVGESGSGKTMTARSLLGLVPRPGRMRGRIELNGREISRLPDRKWNDIRGGEIGMVFQDAMSGLNPVRTVGSLLGEVVRRHQGLTRAAARRRAIDVLRAVGIPSPEERVDAYPHQLSGGLRQRVMIALAIANDPAVIIADEPTTALDATIQAQILERLTALLQDSALIMITHDLGVASAICDRIVVVYAGRLAEVGDAYRVLVQPRHPYTAGLIRAVPRFDQDRAPLSPIPGSPPKPSDIPDSCPFAPRCVNATDRCRQSHPPLEEHDGRLVACFHPWQR
jgi:oligopeptide/dipeptide ABC transporter ATP-binding protein